MLQILVGIFVGAVLGVVAAQVLFIGSALTLIPWALAALALGWWTAAYRRSAVVGTIYGFVLSFVFLWSGYTGSASLLSRVPFFALLSLFGAVSGAILALIGSYLRHAFRR